ncbi:MAG: spherulation-specific family 4 protein [Burkholderiaceae bacterium]
MIRPLIHAFVLLCALATTAPAVMAKSPSSPQSLSRPIEILVPAYFYPLPDSTEWPRLAEAARLVPLVAILNPGSGPGVGPDANYQRVVDQVRAAGGKVIGYVHTSWGQRRMEEVVGDIDRYLQWYPVDGFFIDEMANQNDSALYLYYQAVYNYAKAMLPGARVIGSPGTSTVQTYLTLPTADELVIFEGDQHSHENHYSQPDWVAGVPSRPFAHLVVQAHSAADMHRSIARAVQRNAGLVYVTNDGGANPWVNPWDSLPKYWTAEVQCVRRVNQGKPCQ